MSNIIYRKSTFFLLKIYKFSSDTYTQKARKRRFKAVFYTTNLFSYN